MKTTETESINNIVVVDATTIWVRSQRDLLCSRDIFSAAWLYLQEGKENTEHILWLICDALANDQVWALYFDELWEDKAIQKKFHALHSHKHWYTAKEYMTINQQYKEKLFDDNTTQFCEYITKKIQEYKLWLERQQRIHKDAITTIKKQLTKEYTKNPRIEELTKLIADITKNIKKLDPRLNKGAIEKLEWKKEDAKKELWALQNTTSINNTEKNTAINSTQGKNTIDELQKSIAALQKILDGKDKKSQLFLTIKEEFIKSSHLDTEATRHTKHLIYTPQEEVFMEHIKKRFIGMLQKYKLKPTNEDRIDTTEKNIHDPQYKRAMLEYANNVTLSKLAIINKIDLSEHMISAMGELLQMQLLERELKKYDSRYTIEVKKAPIIDDLRSNTDCLIKIFGWKIPKNQVYYHAADLKTSANEKYVEKEKKNLSGTTYLPGTAHILNINAINTTNSIIEINPSITYSAMATLLTQLWHGNVAPQQNYIDPTIYSNIHKHIAKYQVRENKYLKETDMLLQPRPHIRQVFEKIEELFNAA